MNDSARQGGSRSHVVPAQKVKIKRSFYRLGQALRVPRRLRFPDFKTVGT